MTDLLTPRCPLCGEPPAIMLPGATQAFCGSDDCRMLCWDPSLSAEENLRDPGVIDLPPMEGDGE